jgi:hypothetical protein
MLLFCSFTILRIIVTVRSQGHRSMTGTEWSWSSCRHTAAMAPLHSTFPPSPAQHLKQRHLSTSHWNLSSLRPLGAIVPRSHPCPRCPRSRLLWPLQEWRRRPPKEHVSPPFGCSLWTRLDLSRPNISFRAMIILLSCPLTSHPLCPFLLTL